MPPLSLREETNIDVSPEGLHASGQRSLTFNGCGPQPAQIGRSLHLSHGVVGKYQAAAQRAGLGWPLPAELDDAL